MILSLLHIRPDHMKLSRHLIQCSAPCLLRGQPLSQWPWGVHLNDCLVILLLDFLSVCRIQFHFQRKIIGSITHRLSSLTPESLVGHLIFPAAVVGKHLYSLLQWFLVPDYAWHIFNFKCLEIISDFYLLQFSSVSLRVWHLLYRCTSD